MHKIKIAAILILFCILIALPAHAENIRITNAKMATAINESLMPVKTTGTFSEGAAKVFCWFEWRNAVVNTPIVAKWYYLTDDIHVLDYRFDIPRKEGTGSVSLSMPSGKILPSGIYKIDLTVDEKILKSIKFKVD